jgi:hypothetical protein
MWTLNLNIASAVTLLGLVVDTGFAGRIPHGSRLNPKVTVKNGTYAGVYSTESNQDFFLGVPFAQPPIDQLRFRNPLSLNRSWTGSRSAVAWPPSCVGYCVSNFDQLPLLVLC